MLKRIFSLLLLSIVLGASSANADVTPSSRHVVIIQPSVDMVWGSYLFAAENRSSKPEKARLAVVLPAETIDFKPEEGLEPKDIVLSDHEKANIQVEKAFPPGTTLLGLSFNVQASGGAAELSFTAPYDVGEFVVMAPEGLLSLSGDGMTLTSGQPFVGRRYDMLRATDFNKGKTLRVHLQRVPEGRRSYWVAGGAAAAVVFIGGFGLALLTRPKEQDEGIVQSE